MGTQVILSRHKPFRLPETGPVSKGPRETTDRSVPRGGEANSPPFHLVFLFQGCLCGSKVRLSSAPSRDGHVLWDKGAYSLPIAARKLQTISLEAQNKFNT